MVLRYNLKNMSPEHERQIVIKYKECGFGAYLQGAWSTYPVLQKEIGEGRYPTKELLIEVWEKMDHKKIGFDCRYLFEEVGPLRVEQETWRLLSPLVQKHLDKFGAYIADYQPSSAEKEVLLGHINEGWGLLQLWNLVSESYKAKLSRKWQNVPEREEALKVLIQELQQNQSSSR